MQKTDVKKSADVFEESDEEVAHEWVWIMDEVEAWTPARIVGKEEGKVRVQVGKRKEERIVSESEIGNPITSLASLNNPVSDMVKMIEVDEASIMHNIRQRFAVDDIYTNIGTILVSVNPFKWIDRLYSREYVDQFMSLQAGDESEPHVFAIACAAYNGLRNERIDQSIIISGESGAGKTEATKKCLQFFAEVAGAESGGMEKKLLSANPILEAFGNAKTVRNNNSSRFGKWMAVHFDGRAYICGSAITNYLLEKSRVVMQAPDERNYHIFYQLFAGATSEQAKKYFLEGTVEDYHYTNQSGCVAVEGMPDDEDFQLLNDSMDELDFTDDERHNLFRLSAAVLHLGNVDFKVVDSESCTISEVTTGGATNFLNTTASLLGVPSAVLGEALVNKVIDTGSDRVSTPLTADKAVDARNSLARAVFGRMFDWLVRRVNDSMKHMLKRSANVIGVLDIFGFEIFKHNSFEQLCINFCNEKLQQHFNTFVFKQEEKCYISEGIDYAEVKFIDNQDVLDLVEKKPHGLLIMLDDEVRVPNGSDKSYLNKVMRAHAGTERFKGKTRKDKGMLDSEFGVHHYAGLVVYDSAGFMEKNKDQLHLQLSEMCRASTCEFLPPLFPADSTANGGGTRGRGSVRKSQGGQFREQLSQLMDTLNATAPHYIRCIKPNNQKVRNVYDAPLCLQQLRYAGVFEAVKIRQQGFPFRWTHDMFYKRYRCIARGRFLDHVPSDVSWRDLATDLLEELSTKWSELRQCKFGRTMVLYRAAPHRRLEAQRERIRKQEVRVLQRVYRGHRGRRIFRTVLAARDAVLAAMKSRVLDQLREAVENARALHFRLRVLDDAEPVLDRLQAEHDCREALNALLLKDPVDFFDEYTKTLADAERLEIDGEPVVSSVRAKFATVEQRRQAKADLEEGIRVGDKELIAAAFGVADELRADFGEILDAGRVAKAREVLEQVRLEEIALEELMGALAVDRPTGPTGELNTTAVTTEKLEAAMAHATATKLVTQRANDLMSSARILKDMRDALRLDDWSRLEAVVQTAVSERDAGRLAKACEAELQMGIDEVMNQRLIEKLHEGMEAGAATGVVGNINVAAISTAKLDDALAMGDEFGWKSAASAKLRETALIVHRLRTSMKAEDWEDVRVLLQQLRDEAVQLADVGMEELQLARDEVNNFTMIQELLDGLKVGAASGPVGELDTSTCDTVELSRRIDHAVSVGTKTQQAADTLALAQIVKRLRLLLLAGRWSDVPALVEQAGRYTSNEKVPTEASAEILAARWELEHIQMVEAGQAALGSGAATGAVGRLDRGAVRTAPLESAIALFDRLVPRSPRTRWLYDVMTATLRMRKALVRGSWDDLEVALHDVLELDGRTPNTAPRSIAPVPPKSDEVVDVGDTAVPQPPQHSPPADTDEAKGEEDTASDDARPMPPPVPPVSDAGEDGTDESAPLPPPSYDPEYALPKAVVAEAGAVRDEIDNRSIVLHMTTALATGSPGGTVGNMKVDDIDTAALSTAIESAEQIGVKGQDALQLVESGRLIRQLRQHVVDDDWDGLEDALFDALASGADSGATSAGLKVAKAAEQELLFIRDELDNRCILEDLHEGLLDGRATGEIGAIDMEHLSTAELQQNIDSAEQREPKTAGAKRLLSLARHVRDLRQCVLDADWSPQVEARLDVCQKHLDQDSEAAVSGDRPVVPAETRAELQLIRDCLHDRSINASLTDGLAMGGPQGAVGRLNLSFVNTVDLERRIERAEKLGPKTIVARRLLASAIMVVRLREALRAGDWERLRGIVAQAHETIAPSGDHGASESGSTSAVPSDSPLTAGGKGAARGTWVAEEAISEVSLVEDEMNNRAIVRVCTEALVNGAAQGDTGALDASTIDTTKLGEALAMTEALGCVTEEATLLATTCRLVRRIRRALVSQDFQALEAALAEASGVTVSDLVSHEIRVAQDELDSRVLLMELSSALSHGMASGGPGRMNTATIETEPLSDGLALAQRLGVKTPEARQMLFTAKVVLRLRQTLLSGDYEEAHLTLEAVRGKTLSAVAMHEIRAVQDEVENWMITTECTRAIESGRAHGRVGELDTSVVSVAALRKALHHAEELGCKTAEARELVLAGQMLLRLRLAMLENNWDAVEAVLQHGRGVRMSALALPEMQLAQDEVDNRRVLRVLRSALVAGAASGSVGSIDTSTISLRPLDEGLATAMELGCVTDDAERLLATTKRIRRLRARLLDGNWEDVADILDELESNEDDLAPEVADELSFVRDEVNDRIVREVLTVAFATGAVRGNVGEINKDAISTSDLDVAINRAQSLGTTTPEAAQLLASALLVRHLRAALLADDMPGAQELLTSAESEEVSAPAVAEIDVIRREVDNWVIISETSAALSKGAAAGGVGQLATAEIEVGGLDVAIALAMKRDCQTERARRFLLSALIVRRLRAALIEGDWEFMSEVLAEARSQEDSIVPQAREEIMVARREVEFRSIVMLLDTAIRDRDEAGLTEGLARATRLELARHPADAVRELLEGASLALGRIQRCRGLLAAAIEAVEETYLDEAVAMADALKFKSDAVDEARELLERVRRVTHLARQALHIMSRKQMEVALTECAAVGVNISEIAEIRSVLSLTPEEFLQRELAAAVARRDTSTVARLTMRIKDAFFRECGDMFQLHHFPHLKPPALFSKKHGIADVSLKSGMLKFSPDPLHTSLTQLVDPSARRLVTKTFRSVMTFMGDRSSGQPLAAARELVTDCLRTKGLRDEVLIQVCKQVTENPSGTSVPRGFVLLELLLSFFPPSEDCENYLEYFLRERGAVYCVKALHGSVFTGAADEPPSLEDIAAFVDHALARDSQTILDSGVEMGAVTTAADDIDGANGINPPGQLHDGSLSGGASVSGNGSAQHGSVAGAIGGAGDGRPETADISGTSTATITLTRRSRGGGRKRKPKPPPPPLPENGAAKQTAARPAPPSLPPPQGDE